MNETKQLVPCRESRGSLRRLAAAAVVVALACCTFDARALMTEVVDGVEWTYYVENGKATVGGGSSSSRAVPTGTSGALVVPSTLGGYQVTSIAGGAFYNCSGLKSVTIPEGVTNIGASAFSSCSGLTSMTIPEGVTSIGDRAFYGCYGLTSVTIPSSVTSIGERTFYNCSKLTSVTIPSSVTSIGGWAFSGCSGLGGGIVIVDGCVLAVVGTCPTSVELPQGVRLIADYVFYDCSGLVSITIPKGVTTIGEYAFSGCSGLTSVTIPEGVTSIGENAFSSCSGLTAVTILDGVTSIGASAFYKCSGLKSVTIPEGVTSIGGSAFYNCSGLTAVTIPSSVTNIGENAFSSCSGLTAVTILDGVTSIGERTFCNCSGLTSVTIPSSVTNIGENAFSSCSRLKSVTIPSSVTSIGGWAFSGCSGLTSVTIQKGVMSIGDRAFSGCSGLTSVTIPLSVTSIGEYAFYGCSGLGDGVVIVDGCVLTVNGDCPTSVVLPQGVRLIADHVFYHYSGLTSVTISEGVTSIGKFAFYNCSGLTSASIPSSVTSIGENAFYGCSGLESLTIPEGVTSIADYAFYGCSGLTSVTIPSSVTSIGESAFYGCSGLESVTILKGVTAIGESAFSGCSGLESMTLPEGVASIGASAFRGCSGLTSVTIPEGVTSIGSSAFSGCRELRSVTVPNSVRSIGEYVFSSCAKLEELTIPFVGGERGNEGDSRSVLGFLFSSGSFDNSIRVQQPYDSGFAFRTSYYPASLRKVTITDETVVGRGAFSGFSSLTNVTLNAEVRRIGIDSFGNCSGLLSFDVPECLSKVGSGAFSGCTALTEVLVPSVKTWTDITFGDSLANPLVASGRGKLLAGSRLVTEVTAEDGITNIGDYAFYGYRDLGLVDVPVGVTNVGTYAFASCSSLTNVVIGDAISRVGAKAFDATPVRNVTIGCREGSVMDDFAKCSSLTNIALKGSVRSFVPAKSAGASGLRLEVDGSNLTIENWTATNLRELVLNGTGTQVRDLHDCTGLKTLTLTSDAVFGDYAVYYLSTKWCKALTRVNVPNVETWLGMTFETANANPLNLKKLKGQTVDLYVGGELLTDLRVPDSVTRIPALSFRGYEGLTNVVIGNSVTNIGEYAFYNCTALERIDLPEDCCGFGQYAFSDCTKLTEVVLPRRTTGIGQYAFNNCKALTTVSVAPGALASDGDAVVSAYAFGSCSALTTAVIPGGVASVHKNAFASCSKLADVSLPPSLRTIGGLPSKVKAIRISDLGAWLRLNSPANLPTGYALYLNGKLVEDVALPSDLTKLIAGAFSGCASVKSLTIPPSLKTIGAKALSGCTGLRQLNLSDLDAWCAVDIDPTALKSRWACYLNGQPLTDISTLVRAESIGAYAFYNCTNLVTALLPEGVTNVGDCAFANCTSLERTSVPASTEALGCGVFDGCGKLSVVSLDGSYAALGAQLFRNCTALSDVSIPVGVRDIAADAFSTCRSIQTVRISNLAAWCEMSFSQAASCPVSCGAQLLLDGEPLTDLVVPDGVTEIGDYSFVNCRGVVSVTIPRGVTNLGVSAFANSADLKRAVVGSVGNLIGKETFSSCRALETVELSDGLATIPESMFHVCSGLTSAPIPPSVTKIGAKAFYGCGGLRSVTVPPSVTSVGSEAFYACIALTSVHVSDLSAWCRIGFSDGSANPLNCAHRLYLGENEVVELEIPEDVTSIGTYAFYGCSSLAGILEIPATVTSIGDEAFRECKNLREVRLHGTWGTGGSILFYGCSSLTNVVVDGPVTSIPKNAFCATGLRSFVVPEGVTEICDYAFRDCSQMETVTLPEGLMTISGGAFEYTPLTKTVTIPSTVRTIGGYALSNIKCDLIWLGAPPVIAGTSGASTIPAASTFYVPVNYYLDWLDSGLPNQIIPNDCGSEGPVEISIDAVRPRTPWNGLVDIDVTVSSDEPDTTNSFLLAWSGSANGNARNIRLEGDADYGCCVSVTAGSHRIVWDAGKDLPGRFLTGLTLQVKRFQMSALAWNVSEAADVTVDTRDLAMRYVAEEAVLRRSPRWVRPGERAAETCIVTCDGKTLGTFDTEGELVWRPKSPGVHVLTHVAGGETNVVRMASLVDEAIVVTGQTITSNETWAAGTTHVIFNPVTVRAGVTLTIERGAVVKFFDGASLNVASGGTCLAYGAIFTHVADASVGVDVFDDGGATPALEGVYSTSGVKTDATTEFRCLAPLLLAANVNANTTLLGYRTYIASNDVTVASGKTLTLGAGTVLKFAGGKMMTVKGTLKAVGTKGAPAVFTSLKDDSCGGDTNGDGGATVPAPGDWKKISVSSGGKAVFDHALVRYAARGTNADDAIQVNGGSVVFRDSELAFGQMCAIGVDSGHFYATNSIVRDFYCAIRHWAKDAFVNCVFHDCNRLANNDGQVLRNCTVSGITEAWDGLGGTGVTYDHCVLWNASGVGLQTPPPGFVGANGNLWADPLFFDAGNGDFRISRESPCVDAADGRAAPPADHWARPRMNARTVPTGVPDSQGLYADIGVYEVDGRSTQAVCDLAVESVSVSPSAAVIGDSVSVTYEVANVSDVRALGSACDRIAFVADESEGGLLVAAEEVMQAYDLEPGAKVTLKVRVRVPPAKAGNWRVRVTANAERDIFERVTANNSRESSGSVAVEIRTVVAGEAVTVTVPARGSSAFALTGLGSAGGTVKLDLPPGVKAYAAVGYLPTAGQHDVAGLRIEDGRTALVLPAVEAESEVYVTLVNDGGTEATVVAETEAKAEEVKPSAPADVPVVEHGPAVTMALELPNAVRDGRIYSASVRYANEGDEDAELPIFIVDVKEGDTRLSVCQSGPFTATNVSLVGLAPTAPRGKLKPGESGRVTFYASAMGGLSLRVRRATDAWTCPDSDFTDMAEYLRAMSAAATRLCEVGGAADPGFAEVAGMAKAAKNARVSWVSGHLRHAKTGLPLAGVWLTLARTSSVSRAVSCVKTDKDGAFALGTEYPDTYAVTAPNMAYYEPPVFELSGQDVKNVLLKAYPASVVSGSIRTADGEAVSGAGVWLDDLDTEDVGDFKVTTDADGAYSFAEVLDGSYRILVLPTGPWAMTAGAAFTATNGLDYVRDFVLTDTGCPVAGTVTDGVTGEPVTNATVTFTGSSLPASLPVRVNEEGLFAVSALAAGDYEVSVSSEDKRQPHAEHLTVDGVTPVTDYALKVFDKPVFCATRVAGCEPLITDFRVLKTVRNPEWDFDGDGRTDSKLARPTYSFSGKGWHAVTLTYDDTNGVRRVCRVPDAVMVVGPITAELYEDAAYVTVVEPPKEEGGEAVFELPIEDDDGPEPPKHIVEKGKPPIVWKPKDTKKDDKQPTDGKRRYRARLEEAEIADAFKFYYSEHKITPTKVEWVEPPVVPPTPPPEPPPAVVEPPRDKAWEEVFHGEVDLGRVDKKAEGYKLGHTVTVGREVDPNEDRRFHFWVVDKVTNFVYHTSSRYYWRQSTEMSIEILSAKPKDKKFECVILKKRQPGVTLPYGFTVDPEISVAFEPQFSVGGKAGVDFGASLDVTYRVLQVDGKLTRDVYDSKVTFDPVQPKIGVTISGSADFNVKVQEVLSWMHTLGRVSLGVKGGIVFSIEQSVGVGLDIGGSDGAGVGAHRESSLSFGVELYAALISSAGWLADSEDAQIELGKFSRLGSAKLGRPEPTWESDGLTATFNCAGAKFECDGLLRFMSDWVIPMTACAWTFGDGSKGVGKEVSHTYAHDGVYNAEFYGLCLFPQTLLPAGVDSEDGPLQKIPLTVNVEKGKSNKGPENPTQKPNPPFFPGSSEYPGNQYLSPDGGPYPLPIGTDPSNGGNSPNQRAVDPNEIVGPAGQGEARLVKAGEWMTYTVYFENKADADVPAQEIRVVDQLPASLDWNTFEMLDVSFGSQVESGLSGRAEGSITVDQDGSDLDVKIELAFDKATGRAEWYLRSWDPRCGDYNYWPASNNAGILPPNDETHRGEGYVSYRVKLRDDVPVGTRVDNAATIVFDYNDPIPTDPSWWNTVGKARKIVVSVDGVESEIEVFEGATFGELPDPGTPPEGRSFDGWFTRPDGAGDRITPETVVTPEIAAIYAHWDAPLAYVAEMNGVRYARLADAVKECPYNANSTNEIKILADVEWEDRRTYEYLELTDPEVVEAKEKGHGGGNVAIYKHKYYLLEPPQGRALVASCRDDDWAFFTGQKVAVDLNGHRHTDVWLLIDCAELVIRDTSESKTGAVELLGGNMDLNYGKLTLESGKLIAQPNEYRDAAAVNVFDDSERFDFLGGEIVSREGCAAVYVSNGCIRVGGDAVAANPGCNVVLDLGASLELAAPLTGRIGVTTENDVEGAAIGWNPSGFAGAENLYCDGDPTLRGRTAEDGAIVWERTEPGVLTAPVGDYVRYDLEADLGVVIGPYDSKEKVSAKGLPPGLKLVATKQKNNKKAVTNVVYTVEGVATAVRDCVQQPAYAVVTSGGKTTWQPIVLSAAPQAVTDLGTLALGESVTTNACEWLPGVTNGWSVSGLPTGLKYTAKAVYSGTGKKKALKYPAYTVYGKATKPGLFTITAKKKVGSCYETLKYRATVEPAAVDGTDFPSLSNRTSVVAVAETWNLTNDVGKLSSVSGLPPGLKFDSKKQTVKGTPTKAGTFVTTFKKKVGGKTKSAQILWTVEPNPVVPKVGFNVSGGVVLNRNAGSSYAAGSGAAMAFNVTPGATVTASGLPKGLSIKKVSDGVWTIAGTPSATGTYYVTVTAKLNGNVVTQSVAVKVGAHPLAGSYSGEVWLADDTYGGTVKLTVGSTGKVSLSLVEKGVKTSATLKSVTAVEEDPLVPQTGRWTCTFALKQDKKKVLPKRTLTLVFERNDGEWELPLCGTESYKTADGVDFAKVCPYRELPKAEISARVAAGRIPPLPSVETLAIVTGLSGDPCGETVATGEVVVVSATYKPSAATYTVTGRLPDGKTFSASRPVLWLPDDDPGHDGIELSNVSVSDGAGGKYLLHVYLPCGAVLPGWSYSMQEWGEKQRWEADERYGLFGDDWTPLPATVSDALGEIPEDGLRLEIIWRAAKLPGDWTSENHRFAVKAKQVKEKKKTVTKYHASVSADGGATWVTSKDPISWSAGRASFNVVLDGFTYAFDLALDKDGKLTGWAKKSHTEKDRKGKKKTVVDAVGFAAVSDTSA